MAPGDLLTLARTRAGLSQTELASRSGTSQATLSAYERGRKSPSAATLQRILAAAGYRLGLQPAAQPVIAPTRRDHERTARILREVLELAAALPSEPGPELRFPRLPGREGGARR